MARWNVQRFHQRREENRTGHRDMTRTQIEPMIKIPAALAMCSWVLMSCSVLCARVGGG